MTLISSLVKISKYWRPSPETVATEKKEQMTMNEGIKKAIIPNAGKQKDEGKVYGLLQPYLCPQFNLIMGELQWKKKN